MPEMDQSRPFDPDWTIHPGETLREWREENGLGVKAAATTCGRMDPVVFSAVESGKRRITKTIAAQLQHGTCIPARLWLSLEERFRADLKAGRTWTQ
jgi:plasmid maintenance system antidote protein VapI